MGDKLSNVLIVFIMVIILGLGALYYVKNVRKLKKTKSLKLQLIQMLVEQVIYMEGQVLDINIIIDIIIKA